jgi:hypothetical protein
MSNRPTRKGVGVEDFQVIRFLEEGQFGAVYLARYPLPHSDIGRPTSCAR